MSEEVNPGGWWVMPNNSISISYNNTFKHTPGAFPVGVNIGNYTTNAGKTWFLVVAWPTWAQWQEILFGG
jgi:hypothetical protein